MLFWSASALATVLVVPEPLIPAFTNASTALWPAGEVTVLHGSEVVPRFEVDASTLVWITPNGEARRAVESPEAAVVLMRSWSASPELAGGWTQPTPASVEASTAGPDPARAPARPRRNREVDDLYLGARLRLGVPSPLSVGGLGWVMGLREGPIVVQLEAGARGSRGPDLGVETVSTFSTSLLVGWSGNRSASERSAVRPFVLVGGEFQRRADTQRLASAYTVVPMVSAGLEVHARALGWSVSMVGAVARSPYGRLSTGPLFHF